MSKLSQCLKPAALAAALSAGLFLVGCGAQSGKTIVKYDGKAEIENVAPAEASYALYDSNDLEPRVRYNLKKGDRLGFIKQDGIVYAVAGENEFEVDPSFLDGSLRWKMQDKIE